MATHPPASLVAVLATAAFLVVTAAVTGSADRATSGPRKAELLGLIQDRQASVEQLDQAVALLRADLARAREVVGRRSAADRAQADTLARLGLQAGTVPLRGPGVVVELAHSNREPQSVEEAGAYRIHDTDLQLVVNGLFAAGAEAVAVNDSRVVATTPIRAAGDTILVNFRPQRPPYRVVALGADREAFEGQLIARRFQRWVQLFGLGYKVSSAAGLEVPGYTGRVPLAVAQPAEAR